jgi:hypothetical protein
MLPMRDPDLLGELFLIVFVDSLVDSAQNAAPFGRSIQGKCLVPDISLDSARQQG